MEAPAIAWDPQGAPPMIPSIFVVIACGAISGFHSLVSSGTSSKQCDNEKNALFVSYGSMLTEGILAILVILAIAAGLGMGLTTEAGTRLYGLNAFSHQYVDWNAANGLSAKLGAFVTGATNIIRVLGIPAFIIKAILGVFLVSFAATTLDSATRIQRYVVTEIALSCKWRKLSHKHVATLIAVISAFVLAFCNGSGKGALILWPLFGTVNQLLAGLSLFVITIYLHAKKINYWYALIPMVFMLFITGWAMLYNLQKFYAQGDWLLASIGIIISVLELWMVVEGILIFARASRLRS
jgi:carbon starvation protein